MNKVVDKSWHEIFIQRLNILLVTESLRFLLLFFFCFNIKLKKHSDENCNKIRIYNVRNPTPS